MILYENDKIIIYDYYEELDLYYVYHKYDKSQNYYTHKKNVEKLIKGEY